MTSKTRELTEVDRQTLRIEEQWWKHAGAKEAHVFDLFGESMTRYYQRVDALLDLPAAEAEYPSLVRRLRRLRDQRRGVRSTGTRVRDAG